MANSTSIEVPLSADEIAHLVRILEDREAEFVSTDQGNNPNRITEALIMVRLLLSLRHAQSEAHQGSSDYAKRFPPRHQGQAK